MTREERAQWCWTVGALVSILVAILGFAAKEVYSNIRTINDGHGAIRSMLSTLEQAQKDSARRLERIEDKLDRYYGRGPR